MCNILHVLNFNLCSWKSNFYLDGMHRKNAIKWHKWKIKDQKKKRKRSAHRQRRRQIYSMQHENRECVRVFEHVLYGSQHSIQSSFELYQAEIQSFTYTLISTSTVCNIGKSDYKECDEFIIHKSVGSQMRTTEAAPFVCCFSFLRFFLCFTPPRQSVCYWKDFTFKIPGECMRYGGWMKKKKQHWIVSIVNSIGSDSNGWKSSACSSQMDWITKEIIEFAVHNVFNTSQHRALLHDTGWWQLFEYQYGVCFMYAVNLLKFIRFWKGWFHCKVNNIKMKENNNNNKKNLYVRLSLQSLVIHGTNTDSTTGSNFVKLPYRHCVHVSVFWFSFHYYNFFFIFTSTKPNDKIL